MSAALAAVRSQDASQKSSIYGNTGVVLIHRPQLIPSATLTCPLLILLLPSSRSHRRRAFPSRFWSVRIFRGSLWTLCSSRILPSHPQAVAHVCDYRNDVVHNRAHHRFLAARHRITQRLRSRFEVPHFLATDYVRGRFHQYWLGPRHSRSPSPRPHYNGEHRQTRNAFPICRRDRSTADELL